MKKLALVFCTFPVMLFGQRLVTTDSTWRSSANGFFYENRAIEYSTGESSTTKTLVGDTLTVFANMVQQYVSEANGMAQQAREAVKFDKRIGALVAQSDDILSFVGRDVLDTLTARYSAPLLQGGWTVKDTAGTLDIVFSVNNNGQLRYVITGFQARNAVLLGSSVLRLSNFKATGQPLDFFLAQGGNWFTLENKTKLRFPGNADVANRAAPAPQGIRPAPPKTSKKGEKKKGKQ